MPIAKSSMADSIQAGVSKNTQEVEEAGFGGFYTVTCFDSEGRLKWEEKFHNQVTTVGVQNLNNVYFNNTAFVSWYLGLTTGVGASVPSYNTADTMSSHAGWVEVTAYSGTRKAVNWGTGATATNPSTISNSASPAVFSITGSATVYGAFLVNDATNGGTAGTLFSAGNFTTSAKNVVSGDTINVTYTFSATGL